MKRRRAKVASFILDNSLLLLVGTATAVVWANLAPESYARVADPLHFWVNDILMVFFFGLAAKEVFEAMWSSGEDADAIIEKKGLRQITDTSAIEKAIDEVMAKNPGQLADYRSGKDKLFGFFVGQVMKATGGKANPAQLNELLKKKLAP